MEGPATEPMPADLASRVSKALERTVFVLSSKPAFAMSLSDGERDPLVGLFEAL